MIESLQMYLSQHAVAELSLVVVIVVICAALARALKQPLLIGYILAGIIASPAMLNLIHNPEAIEIFAKIGIALLLFMVWLGLNPRVIKEMGKVSLYTGLWQILFTSIVGFGIAMLLGFSITTAIYVCIALTFSSTIVIIKLLSDRGDTEQVYGKISIGLLIVQDIVAMAILMVLSALNMADGSQTWYALTATIVMKLWFVAVSLYLLAKYVLVKLTKRIAHSQEMLLLFAIGRCLLVGTWMEMLGFSLEIGALLAGMTLASVPYRFEIASRTKPLRDFFIALFFLLLGSHIDFSVIMNVMPTIIIFSLFVLIGNPLIVMTIMGIMGYTKKNSFMVGLTCAQISEFSFILIGIGLSIGHLTDPTIASMVTVIGLITIIGSSYFITYADQIYNFISPYLSIFEPSTIKSNKEVLKQAYEAVVFGNHRLGEHIVRTLYRNKKKFIVVDFDPQVIENLQARKIPCLYGDASERELLQEINLIQTKRIISTIHDFDTNSSIISYAKQQNPKAILLVHAMFTDEAIKLYDIGADYVIVPHTVGSHQTALMINEFGDDISKYMQHKQEHLVLLGKK